VFSSSSACDSLGRVYELAKNLIARWRTRGAQSFLDQPVIASLAPWDSAFVPARCDSNREGDPQEIEKSPCLRQGIQIDDVGEPFLDLQLRDPHHTVAMMTKCGGADIESDGGRGGQEFPLNRDFSRPMQTRQVRLAAARMHSQQQASDRKVSRDSLAVSVDPVPQATFEACVCPVDTPVREPNPSLNDSSAYRLGRKHGLARFLCLMALLAMVFQARHIPFFD
jgi:hypothetical protein